jgi:hypothetical protein
MKFYRLASGFPTKSGSLLPTKRGRELPTLTAQISAAKTLLDYGLRFTEFNDILKILEENNAL